MGKTIGLFACASVVTASVWWASSTQTGQPVSAGTELESTAPGPVGFGGAPAGANGAMQAAQQARIQDLMRRAALMEQQGNTNAALRFASSAEALSRGLNLAYPPGQESPADLVARLQGRSPRPSAPAAMPPVENPFAPSAQPAAAPLARNARPAPTLPGTDSPEKKQAQELLRQARRAFDAGELDAARSTALDAKQLGVVFGLFEETPDQLLADIERKTNSVMISPPPDAGHSGHPFDSQAAAPAAAPQEKASAPGNPFAVLGQSKPAPSPAIPQSAPQSTLPGNSQRNPNEASKSQAIKLLADARKDANAGRYGSARDKVKQAQELDVIYNVFDERPELVLEDVNRMEAKVRGLAKQDPATPAPPVVANATPDPQAANREKVQTLLAEARDDIRASRFDEADQKIQEAKSLNVNYEVFDDRPESVAQLLDRYRPSAPVITPRMEFPPPSFPPTPSPAPERAPIVLADTPAPSFPPVSAPVPAPAPKISAPKLPAGNPFAVVPPAAPTTEPITEPTFEPMDEDEAGNFNVAKKAAPPTPHAVVVHPSGVTATELFDRGLKHFNDGKIEEAYDAFLHCYRTGQKMDPYRSQSLQDMLQALRPMVAQMKANVQQVKGEAPGDERRFGPGSGENALQSGGLNLVEKELAVKYEKLRSETVNAIFRADRLKEKKSGEALELLDRTLANVSDSDLSEEQLTPLVRQLKMARGDIEAWQKQRAPIIAMEEENDRVKGVIKKEREYKVRVEQELADMVEEFNGFFKQRRYAEAEVVAKKAKELDPENPVTETMFWKARFARRDARNQEVKLAKEEGFYEALDSVEGSAIPFDDRQPIQFPKNWDELTKRRAGKYGTDNHEKTEEEERIEKSLNRPVSLHFSETPLHEVIKHVATTAGINVVVDNLGLDDEGVSSDQAVTIDVDGIRLSSALNLMLEPMRLAYLIQDDVLKITSEIRQQGKLEVRTYPVADLVIPIPNFSPSGGTGMTSSGTATNAWGGSANYSVPVGGSLQPVAGAQYQIPDNAGVANLNNPWGVPGLNSQPSGGGSNVDFDTLSDLIISTVEPSTWSEAGGSGSVRSYETTLSLVIRQTQKVHEEIRDLLEQLRRLQDLQVTIEVRFIAVADRFFERIGVDFDFSVQDNVEGDDLGLTPPAFGSPGLQGVVGVTGQQQQGQAGQQAQAGQAQTGVGGIGGGPGARNALIMGVPGQQVGQQAGQAGQAAAQAGAQGFFNPPVGLNLPALDDWPKNGTITGLASPGQFTPDLDVQFQQGSFDLGVPDFGNFNPDAGIQVGMAILSDIEAFFFIQAAQADERTNIMFAPKVTLFNGQQATVQSTTQRPFVTSLIPTVGFFSVGFTPQITVLSEGVTLTVSAVISADRRFVRLTVVPAFTNITDVFTFTFSGGGGGQQGQVGNGQANSGVAGSGQFGGQIGGAQQGQGGGQAQVGVGGIGGGPGAMNALAFGLPMQLGGQYGMGGIGGVVGGGQVGGGQVGGGQVGGQQGGQQGQQGGQVGQGGAAVGNTTIQQPVFEVVNVTTTVSVPDGGTVLLGGVKRLREGRNMAGVPILNKIPYISRLFKNTGVGRETESLMLMVTPRIIIQEEEEELLGIPL